MYSYFWLVSDISNYVSISVSKNNPGPIQKSKHAVHLHVKNKVQFAFTYVFKMCSKMIYQACIKIRSCREKGYPRFISFFFYHRSIIRFVIKCNCPCIHFPPKVNVNQILSLYWYREK